MKLQKKLNIKLGVDCGIRKDFLSFQNVIPDITIKDINITSKLCFKCHFKMLF